MRISAWSSDVCSSVLWRDHHLFFVNTTDSLPNWAFLVDRGRMPAKGDYVFFAPPRTPLLRRHFGARAKPFGKIVYGVAGDVVAHRGDLVTINGKAVARMKARTDRKRTRLNSSH